MGADNAQTRTETPGCTPWECCLAATWRVEAHSQTSHPTERDCGETLSAQTASAGVNNLQAELNSQ